MRAPDEHNPTDRLATTTETGSRVYLYLADVRGFFRRWRNHFYDVLLVIFLGLPWLKIDGQPLLLLDIPNRKFHIFGLVFWGHDLPILFLVIIIFLAALLLATALLGRVWCGWACPQTVFIDRVYRRIERWIDGSPVKQRQLAESDWNTTKIFKRTLKWSVFLLVSMIITHSFLAYFVGTDAVFEMITQSPAENPTSFAVIVFTTALILFDFGWFREQFCIIACPYGRLQSVLLDDDSVVVAYDTQRGEPRRTPDNKNTGYGDCVDCHRCVQVCPTGIDIRRGLQMECIACTACIDACDEVMTKIDKPKGLIRYDTERGLEGKKTRWIRLRVILYALILVAAAVGLSFIVSHRNLMTVNFVRATQTPFQLIDDGQAVINHVKMNIRNQRDVPVLATLTVSDAIPEADQVRLTMAMSPLTIPAQKSLRQDVFVTFPRSMLRDHDRLPVVITVVAEDDPQTVLLTLEREVVLVGPLSRSGS